MSERKDPEREGRKFPEAYLPDPPPAPEGVGVDVVSFLRARLDETAPFGREHGGEGYHRAHREILKAYQDAEADGNGTIGYLGGIERGLRLAVLLIAETYRNHPDWRPEWSAARWLP